MNTNSDGSGPGHDWDRRSVLKSAAALGLVRASGAAAESLLHPYTPIFAIRYDGDLLAYEHTGVLNGTAAWSAGSGRTISNSVQGFATAQVPEHVFGGVGGVVYVIRNGDLYVYSYNAVAGWAPWSGRKIGNGWDFRQVFAGAEGAIYAIRNNGDMLLYRHLGTSDGANRWAPWSGTKIGNGWGFLQVFAGDDGAIYAIRLNGDMLAYRHLGWSNGTASWAPWSGRTIGNGWSFRHVFCGRAGSIYAVSADGDMLAYRHLDWIGGTRSWAPWSGRRIGHGWDFRDVFATH
jgi:hypothetical protein